MCMSQHYYQIHVPTIISHSLTASIIRHQARDKYRLKTDRNFELASMDPTTTIEPTTTTTTHHPLGGDELEHAESKKAKEALNGAEEVVAVATVTPAEGSFTVSLINVPMVLTISHCVPPPTHTHHTHTHTPHTHTHTHTHYSAGQVESG